MLASLKSLAIGSNVHLPYLDRESRRPPLPTRTVLPALALFEFDGASAYLDELVARINAPFFDTFYVSFIDEFIFDISQLAQFMRRTTRIQVPNEAHVQQVLFDVRLVNGVISMSRDMTRFVILDIESHQ